MVRHSHDEYFLHICDVVSSRSTCRRRAVGCVLVDSSSHIISTGYNGVPKKAIHCTSTPCDGVRHSKGEGLDDCQSIHAEANAIAHAFSRDIVTGYITVSPCMSCIKLLLATKCRRIVFREIYSKKALAYWSQNGGKWELVK